MTYGIILGIIVFVVFATTVAEGLWSNVITLIQITLSGLIAFGFYQPITIKVDEYFSGEFTYALDIVVLWFMFSLSMIILKILCEGLSKTRAKYIPQVDRFAGAAVGLVAGLVMAGFVGATLHTAPLPKDTLGGGMDYPPGDLSSAGMGALDIGWLRMVEAASATGLAGHAEFNAEDFVAIYGDHRDRYSRTDSFKVKRSGGR